jgi:glutaredoxin-related protein
MNRPLLQPDRVHPAAHAVVTGLHADTLQEVVATVAREPWVVVGMAQNPVVKKARQFLEAEGIPFTYLEYGSYLKGWKRRLAIKLWAGFPTFPMVFRDGVLLGGHSELCKLKEAGELRASPTAAAAAR